MPKKYHRPPTAKRRKSRRTTIPYEFEGTHEATTAAVEVNSDGGASVAVDVAPETVAPETVAPRAQEAPRGPERHIVRDYSYVQGEVMRIAVIVGFLVISLIITSFFR